MSSPRVFSLKISPSLTQMLDGYSHDGRGITDESFPWEGGPISVEAVLSMIDETTPTDDVLALLEQRGQRPSTMHELAAFRAQHPSAEPRPVVALGSIVDIPGGRGAGMVHRQRLSLRYCHVGWNWDPHYVFLVVHK